MWKVAPIAIDAPGFQALAWFLFASLRLCVFEVKSSFDQSFVSTSEEQTRDFAKGLAGSLTTPAHILLYGELGAGKTAFAKGLAAGFGFRDMDEVSSPTFTLVNRYEGRVPIYHIDLYRLMSGELDDLGLEDIFCEDAAVVVEWAERLGSQAPPDPVLVALTYIDDHTRRIELTKRRDGVARGH